MQREAAHRAIAHAELDGLSPRKGSIGVGFDADLTLRDPSRGNAVRPPG